MDINITDDKQNQNKKQKIKWPLTHNEVYTLSIESKNKALRKI